MRINTRILSTVLLAALALSVSCSDDDGGNPTTTAPEEIVLATFTGAGSSSGPDQPPQPYGMYVEIGVDSEVIPGYTRDPEPMLFTNAPFGDDTNFMARPWNTDGLGIMAQRLTDGDDTTIQVYMRNLEGGGSSNFGLESQVLIYEPGLSRVGPDLDGYTVTGVRVQLDLEVTDNAGWWTQAYDCTISIIGY